MTQEQLYHLRGLIYESEVRAMNYGRESQRLAMLEGTDPKILQARKGHEKRYHENWGRASKELQDFINSLVKE
ncbi:hypothetical protein [Serratia phage X20]|uniref:Uncharacterized protein n=3 Tax=Winklervirus TaxID=2560256 RepID=A0A1Z1LZE4_9CAUD|nr:hypothetical protein FDI23_gp192 [Serratia phage CHI14]YP_010092378.1 hypothetical protein KNT72_gp188 [Serratia phage X20]ARW57646.1 hypothetical protein [Serratia phage CHI14]ARW57921.1 hypothetical protein [Serratia phage CBH8]ARW58200.1 hypothetical protein [Serratia phage X20]